MEQYVKINEDYSDRWTRNCEKQLDKTQKEILANNQERRKQKRERVKNRI